MQRIVVDAVNTERGYRGYGGYRRITSIVCIVYIVYIVYSGIVEWGKVLCYLIICWHLT